MIFTDRGASIVRIANLDGTGLQTLIPSAGSNIRGVAIDLDTDDLFYADNGANIIYRTRLDGSGRVAIVSTGLGFPADIALDHTAQKIHWCDRDNNRIERANYDGTGRETLVNTTSPYYLDLDLTNQKLYWGDFSGGNIFRADLADGNNGENFVSGLIQTRGVKVDPGGGYVYWCDREAHKVQRRTIGGGVIEDLYTGLDTPHGMTLDIPARKIYWVDTGTNNIGGTGARAVSRGDMDGSGAQEVLANVTQPWDITLDLRVNNYPEWQARRFRNDAPPSVTSGDANPDSDQHLNLAEYFAGLDPFRSESIQATRLLPVDDGFQFTYRQSRHPIGDIIATVELASDLRNWRSGPAVAEFLAQGDSGDGALESTHKIVVDAINPNGTQVRLRLQLVAP